MRRPHGTNESERDSHEPSVRGRSRAWLVSLLVHLVLLLTVSLIPTASIERLPTLLVTAFTPEPLPEFKTPQEFHASPDEHEEIGSSSLGGVLGHEDGQTLILPEQVQPPVVERAPVEVGTIDFRETVEAATGTTVNLQQSVKGTAGVGVTGAEGAIDRISQEVLLSLEERDTLLVWFFDRTASVIAQWDSIEARFQRVYEELGVTGKSGDDHLLSAVVSYGAEVDFPIPKPTADVEALKEAIASIEQDASGQENVFTALEMGVQRFRRYTTSPRRNVMFVVFSDEAGNDQDKLDSTIAMLRKLAIPVYVVGVPAPFARRETLLKYVDPDPAYEQTPQWGIVEQGPESMLPEGLKIYFQDSEEAESPIDSGYGPFALTRLCYETGGIYFTVHPNRASGKVVRRHEIQNYSSYLQSFFDPTVMRRYRPDYVSSQEYQRLVSSSQARSSLIQAAQMSWLSPLEDPRQRFLFQDEARFAQELTEAQKDAAKIEPFVAQLYEVLKSGTTDREKETSPRWQAGYDLAIGRVLAVKVRTETYNAMLAQAKQGLKFQNPQNNTWQLVPADEVTAGSRHERDAKEAKRYLERVVQQHPETPWALLAARELKEPLSWKWEEDFTPIEPPREAVAANNPPQNNIPQNEQRRQLERPVKKRPLPKL